MKILKTGLSAIIFLVAVTSFAQTSDPLLQQEIKFQAGDGSAVLTQTATHLKALFSLYKIALDGNSQLLAGPTLSGTELQPRLQATVRDCVAFICQTVNLDTTVTAVEVDGPCQRNLVVSAGLANSSSVLANMYEALDVKICLNPGGTNESILSVDATARRASTFQSGIVQTTILHFLNLQAPNMIEAIKESLTKNGAQIE